MLLLLCALLSVSHALTPEEIAAFKPRMPDYVERNTGLKAHYTFTVNTEDDTLTFSGNDIPPHDTWVFPQPHDNPNELLESDYTLIIPNTPVFRAEPFTVLPHGAVGISTTGIKIYANFPDVKGCPYVPGFEELDICDGHPSPFNDYHHHYYAHCIAQPVCGAPAGIVGVAIDGIPIYGPFDEFGRQLTGQDTDECGGMEDSSGRYKYHMTIDPPFFMDCLKGEILKTVTDKTKGFFASCPYDDTSNMHPPGPHPPHLNRPPPPPPRTLVCDFKVSGRFANCTNNYNASYDIGVEWVRTWKKVDLAPCCPEGEDCGYSCKTEKGIKEECYVEKRTVAYTEVQPRGFCSERCTAKCEKKEGKRRKRCLKKCMNFCLVPKGNPNFAKWPEI